jgi:hypothetical protein
VHAGRRTVKVPLFDRGLADTDYPFLLFVSRAETEAVLNQRLARAGITVERASSLLACRVTGPKDLRPADSRRAGGARHRPVGGH